MHIRRYADLEVLEMVLAARPPPPLLLSGRDHNDSWLLPISYGDVRFYERLVEAYTPSEHGLMFAKPLDGFSWLSVAMLSLGASQKEILDLLLANGAAMQVDMYTCTYTHAHARMRTHMHMHMHVRTHMQWRGGAGQRGGHGTDAVGHGRGGQP